MAAEAGLPVDSSIANEKEEKEDAGENMEDKGGEGSTGDEAGGAEAEGKEDEGNSGMQQRYPPALADTAAPGLCLVGSKTLYVQRAQTRSERSRMLRKQFQEQVCQWSLFDRAVGQP